jgi:2-polyprenyl-6-methoxyphenol hydroxylase-like FAD-dependent oxidoreductase
LSVDTEKFWKDCGPCVALPRNEMHTILRAALGGLPIHYSRTISAVHQTPFGCIVTFDNGSLDTYDLVAAADGIHSQLRAMVLSPQRPVYAGNVCWRFITQNTLNIDHWLAMTTRNRSLLAIPVSASETYVYADVFVSKDQAKAFSSDTNLAEIFSDFSAPLGRLLTNLPSAGSIHFSPIEKVCTERWASGRIVLIGDAAHASSPSMAEGAGMAFEDAIVLARSISDTGTVDQAIRRFLARRKKRVARVQRQSDIRDRIRTLPNHLTSTIIRHAGQALYRRSYRPLLVLP